MSVRVGINGFGRIGRNFFRAARKRGADVEIVAVNDLGDAATMAHLLKYDSVMGPLDAEVEAVEGAIRVGDTELKLLNEREPGNLPWGDLGIDVAIESTGLFTKRDQAQAHLSAGAKKVLISATATDAAKAIGLVIPELQGKVDGVSVRAPVPTGSITDLVVRVGGEVTPDEV